MKKLIAYSSVAHMGFVTLGIFTLTKQGIEGSIFQMISHGLNFSSFIFMRRVFFTTELILDLLAPMEEYC